MAVAAEQLVEVGSAEQPVFYMPVVLEAAEMHSDELIRKRTAHFIGSIVLEETLEIERTTTPHISLMDAINEASRGNEQALHMVRMNVATDVMERTFKSGHITEVPIEQDEYGTLFQFGQPMHEVYANSFRYMNPSACMQKRLEAEALNGQRIQTYAQSGLLDDYAFVVFSLVPDDIDSHAAKQEGFFTDTMSGVIQLTTKKGDAITVESAFIAGTHTDPSERHDKASIQSILREYGTSYEGKSTTEILSEPLLIHKSALPRGVIDLVEQYDSQTQSFFGQQQPVQSYDTYRDICSERESSMQEVTDRVTRRLLDAADSLTSPTLASALLNTLSEEETLQRALIDTAIDPRVYGQQAAQHIVDARVLLAQGKIEESNKSLNSAKAVAQSSSCAGNLRQINQESQDAACESNLTCKEVKDGEHVKCPGCMKMVRAIVPDKETIYCSNKRCKLAHPSLK